MIDYDSPTPVYVQIADAIAARIASGELLPDRPIPSETRLCQEFGVARTTARHAVEELRNRGLVFTVPQRGTYVTKQAPLPPDPQDPRT